MSRKSSAPPKQPVAKPAKASANPTEETLRRLADMIGRGFDATRMEREAASILSAWSQTLDLDDLQERLDMVRTQLAEGIEAAEEQADDIEDSKAAALVAQRTMQAMRATHSAFSRAAAIL